ncbi:MAG: primosomal protein N' [Bacteroidales bacterium]|jgi:primosomal protein N' (replication factor Y)|nr:primosomal protein N' [Bacteroidales bacterium]
MLFVDVILPLALPQSFTYAVPCDLHDQVQPGVRVIVPVGNRKFYSGIVEKIHCLPPEKYAVKEMVSVLDRHPVAHDVQIRLWRWVASYYMCTVGEVMRVAIPAGLKLESETCVYFNPAYVQCDELTEQEEEILQLASDKKCLLVSEIAAKYQRKDMMRVVQSLVDKEALWVEEFIADRYKPKSETCIRLHPSIDSEEKLAAVFDKLKKAQQQSDVMMNYVRLSSVFSVRGIKEVTRKELLPDRAHAGALHALVKKQVLELYTVNVSRLEQEEHTQALPELTACQQEAMGRIRNAFSGKDVVLLHGVTSSGKTEIYIRLIEEQIRMGNQVLYLLPEIALTAQIIHRLASVFGRRVGIYHSKFSDAERVEVWNRIGQPDGYSVVLGVRSAVFLPFTKLGLVIVDEEHENTYKQYDPAPRYHARDTAVVLASLHRAKVLMGTATPAIETYYNACEGKYGLVELTQRYAGLALPEIIIADTSLARKQKKMQSHFHPDMLEAIGQTLDAGKQVILFQNRRGFAPYVQCRICEHVPRCRHCDVSLTYHKFLDRLVCHYCGYGIDNLHQCPECGGKDMTTVGFGTEKIEDETGIFFPHARIARLDLDTARSRHRYEKIIAEFEQRKTDILIGTQMVTKGLNFDHVHMVGILNADNMLNFPDFRAFERSYQLMVQVGGRAGRYGEQGKVIIQTSTAKHPVLLQVIENDYHGMYRAQIAEREKFLYPPFYRIIRITLKHKQKETLHRAAGETAAHLSEIFGRRVLGPEAPVIARLQTYYLENILLKIERQASLSKVKTLLSEAIARIRAIPAYRTLRTVIDVDPL